MEYQDYYKIMGVKRDATQDEIKRAYRKLARKYHPDVSTEADAEVRFKQLGEAYEVLKDPEKRAAYDQLGQQWKAGQDFKPPPGWDPGFDVGGGRSDDDFGFSDFFENLYRTQRAGGTSRSRSGRRAGGRAAAMRGEDHHARIQVELEDSFNGATRSISLQIPEVNPEGFVTTRNRTLNVKIPKGIRPGQQIRLAGQGGPGFGDAPAGDLYLEVEFKPHRRYRLEDNDLYVDLPVAPWEAALGGKVKLSTPAGTVDLTIPSGSQSGQKLRLGKRGLPPDGDLIAVLKLVNPPVTGEASRQAWRELQKQFDFNPRTSQEA